MQVLGEIVVTATGTEVPLKDNSTSTTIITRQQMEARQIPRVENYLRDVPGATISQAGGRGGQTSLFLRGGNSNMNLVMLNGFRLNDIGGAFDFNKLTVDNLNRIEVVRGPMSSLYGNDAMTGIISLMTRQGRGPAKLTLSTQWGGHAEGHSANNLIDEQRVNLEGSWKKFSYSMAYGHYDDSGILSINNRFASNVVNSRFDLEPSDKLKLTLTNYYVDTYYGFPTSSGDRFDAKSLGGNGLDPAQNQKTSTVLTGLTGNFWPVSWWQNELLLGFLNLDSRYNNPANPFFVNFQTTNYYSRDIEKHWTLNYRSNFFWGAPENLTSVTTLGVETRHAQWKGWNNSWDWNTMGYSDYMTKARRGSFTWYVQEQVGAWKRFFLTVGGSLEDNSAFQKLEFCPRASASLRFPETDTTLRAAGGKAVKAPSFTETNSLDPFFMGNPALLPEKNVSWEVGLDQWLWHDRLQGGMTYFENHFTDMIQYTQTSLTTGSFFNIAAARTKGFEFYLKAKPFKGLTARTAYTYLTELKVLDDGGLVNINIITGQNLLRRPRQSWNFDLNYVYGPVEVNFHGYYIGPRADRRPGNNPPYYASRLVNGGFFTADLAASYTVIQKWGYVRRLQLVARALNLFDKKYEEVFGYSSPRFQIIGGLKLEM
ncbi:MAG: TonB-dependent receptor plug domain-containing protein [Deltaproteobacteria bacterium]